MKEKILIVDDDKYIALLLYNFLEDEGFVCETAEDGLEALERVSRKNDFDMVLLDFVMPRMNGLEFLAAVKEINPKLPVLMISGYRTRDNTLEALRLGAIGFIKKPFSLNDVLSTLRLVFNVSGTRKELGLLIPHLTRGSMEFVFKTSEVEPDKISFYLATHLGEMGLIEGRRISTVALAFNEVITNAIEHGNLELPINYFFEESDNVERAAIMDMKGERLKDCAYANRSVKICYGFDCHETTVSVSDEGPGFNTASVMEFLINNNSSGLENCGRGLRLLKYAVDEVRFNEKGNQVTLVIR